MKADRLESSSPRGAEADHPSASCRPSAKGLLGGTKIPSSSLEGTGERALSPQQVSEHRAVPSGWWVCKGRCSSCFKSFPATAGHSDCEMGGQDIDSPSCALIKRNAIFSVLLSKFHHEISCLKDSGAKKKKKKKDQVLNCQPLVLSQCSSSFASNTL